MSILINPEGLLNNPEFADICLSAAIQIPEARIILMSRLCCFIRVRKALGAIQTTGIVGEVLVAD
jgi:hypothetical protein